MLVRQGRSFWSLEGGSVLRGVYKGCERSVKGRLLSGELDLIGGVDLGSWCVARSRALSGGQAQITSCCDLDVAVGVPNPLALFFDHGAPGHLRFEDPTEVSSKVPHTDQHFIEITLFVLISQ